MTTITGPLPAAADVEIKLTNDPSDSSEMRPSQHVTCNLQVDFATEDLARVALVTLSVDPELKPNNVWREMRVEGRRLVIKFTATDARYLRASFSSFMDLLVLAVKTIEEFGPGSQYMPT